MFAGLNRLGLLALCLSPALVFGARVPGSLPVATYMSACGGSGQSPTVRTYFVTAHRPARHSKSAPVELFIGTVKPTRAYEPVGIVHVVARVSGTGEDELRSRAMQAARGMGGDALVDIQVDDAAHTKPPVGNVGTLALVASVVRWSDRAN